MNKCVQVALVWFFWFSLPPRTLSLSLSLFPTLAPSRPHASPCCTLFSASSNDKGARFARISAKYPIVPSSVL